MKTVAMLAALAMSSAAMAAQTYGDSSNELFDNGFGHLDIVSVTVSHDASSLFFDIETRSSLSDTNWGKYCIGINTGAANPDTSNGWGRNRITWGGQSINYWIGTWADGGSGGEVRQMSGMNDFSNTLVDATYNPPDARGTWSVTIAKRRGGERAHIAEVIVREGVGVINAVSGWMSRSQIKEAHQRIHDSSSIAPAPVPVEWVRFRVQKALEDNAKSGQLVPLGLERCKDLLEPAVTSEPAHPLAALQQAVGDGAAEAVAGLHNEPEFRSWLPDVRAIDEVLRRVGQKLTPEDVSDQKKVDETLREEMKLATDRYFTPEQRAEVARRMRDAAVTIRHRAGDERAKEILKTAHAIEAAGLITAPPSEIDFLRVFFQKGIAFLAQQTGGQLRVPVAAAPAGQPQAEQSGPTG